MPILHLYDRAGLLAAPGLTVDPELRDLLAGRVRHLQAEGLLDMTEIVVVDGGAGAAEVAAVIGFDPLVDGDGRRHGDPAFASPIDGVARVGRRHYEAIVCVGNSGFAFQLLVRDDAAPALVALMRDLMA